MLQKLELEMQHDTAQLTYNDESEVAGAVVMMLKGDNSSRVIDEVKERIIQIRKTLT
jgi:cobalt-zinc-cadmium resistance protein CzcA